MKAKLTNNFGLKLISVLFSIVLWLVVVNIDDPVTTKRFTGIPVSILNEDAVTGAGRVYEILDESNTVDLVVKAKRSVLESLNKSDFQATADMKELSFMDTVTINVVSGRYNEKILDIIKNHDTLKIAIEEKASKQLQVELIVNGTPGEGYTVGDTALTPNTITVNGPESVISKVDTAEAVVDVSNITADMNTTVIPKIYDVDGEEISTSRLEVSATQMNASVTLLHTKSVDLNFEVEGKVADGYRYMGMNYSPTTIALAGSEEELAEISTIIVPSSELNIEGAFDDQQITVDISKYIPDNVRIVDKSDAKVTVSISISKLGTKELTVPIENIDLLNLPTGLQLSYVDTNPVTVKIQGLASDLGSITEENISLSIDLKGKTEGSHESKIAISVPSDCGVIGEYSIFYTLTKVYNDAASGNDTAIQ